MKSVKLATTFRSDIKGNDRRSKIFIPKSDPFYKPLSGSALAIGDVFWYNNDHYRVEDKTALSLVCTRNRLGTYYYFDQKHIASITVLLFISDPVLLSA